MAEGENKEEILQQELEIALAQQKRLQNMKKILKAQEDSEEKANKISKLNKLLSKTHERQKNLKQKVSEYQSGETTALVKQNSIYDDINDSLEKNKENVQKTASTSEKNLNIEKQALDTQKSQNEQIEQKSSLADKYSEKLTGSISDLRSQIDSLPGGDFLSSALGVDQLQENLGSVVSNSLNSGDFKGFASSMQMMFANMKATLMSTLGVIGLIIGAIAIIYSVFSSIHQQTQDVSQNLGISATRSREMVDQSRAWTGEMSTSLATQEDILESEKAIVQEFGTMMDVTKTTTDTVVTMNKAFGVSNEAAAGVSKTLQQMGASAERANKISIFTANLAEAAGIPAGPVMEDIAENAEFAMKHFSGMPKKLAQAAVEANRLGLSLSDVSEMTQGILDIESSLENEMKAQVMLGKQINFDAARRKALAGEPVKAAKSMLKQMGGITEFNKMDLLQKEAIAEATGLSTDKLGEYMRRQSLINQMDEEQKEKLREANKQLENMNSLSEEQILKEKEQKAAMSELSASWSKIKTQLSQIIVPLADLLLPIFQAIADTVSTISEVTGQRWAGGLAIIAVGFLPKIMKGLSRMGGMVGSVTGKMGTLLSKSKKLQKINLPGSGKGGGTGMVSKLNNAVSKINPKQMLAAGAAMVMVAGAVWILSKAMQNFSSGVSWEGVLMGITSLFALTAAVAALGALMLSGVGAAAILAGAAAMAIIAGAIWGLSKALENFTEYSDALIGFFNKMTQIDGKSLYVVAGGIGAISTALAAFSASNLMSSVTSAFSRLFGGGIMSQLEEMSNMAGGLKTVASSIDLISSSLSRLSNIDISDIVNSLNSIDTEVVINMTGGAGIEQNQSQTGTNTNVGEQEPVGQVTAGGEIQKNVIDNSRIQNETINNNTEYNTENVQDTSNESLSLLLNKLIEKVDQPIQVKVGNKVVDELTKQQSMKRNIQFGFD